MQAHANAFFKLHVCEAIQDPKYALPPWRCSDSKMYLNSISEPALQVAAVDVRVTLAVHNVSGRVSNKLQNYM